LIKQELKKYTYFPDYYDFPKINNLNTSAGYSFPGKKKSDVFESAFQTMQYIKHQVKRGKTVFQPPCKLAYRPHLSSRTDPKVRPVWVYPFELILLEAPFVVPLNKRFQKDPDSRLLYGEHQLQRLVDVLRLPVGSEMNGLTLDWKSFDSSIPPFLIRKAFDIIYSTYTFPTP
jgi:hypothetical protein